MKLSDEIVKPSKGFLATPEDTKKARQRKRAVLLVKGQGSK